MSDPEEPQEIERVFLLERLPDLPAGAVAKELAQGYLPDVEGAEGAYPEGRVRRSIAPDGSARYTHTIKRGEGMTRTEIERAIDREEFERLWARTAGRRLTKTRHVVPAGDLTWEVDAFHDLPLVMAEVELPSEDHPLTLPGWLEPHVVREVTWDPRYRNFALATQGPPQD